MREKILNKRRIILIVSVGFLLLLIVTVLLLVMNIKDKSDSDQAKIQKARRDAVKNTVDSGNKYQATISPSAPLKIPGPKELSSEASPTVSELSSTRKYHKSGSDETSSESFYSPASENPQETSSEIFPTVSELYSTRKHHKSGSEETSSESFYSACSENPQEISSEIFPTVSELRNVEYPKKISVSDFFSAYYRGKSYPILPKFTPTTPIYIFEQNMKSENLKTVASEFIRRAQTSGMMKFKNVKNVAEAGAIFLYVDCKSDPGSELTDVLTEYIAISKTAGKKVPIIPVFFQNANELTHEDSARTVKEFLSKTHITSPLGLGVNMLYQEKQNVASLSRGKFNESGIMILGNLFDLK